MINLRPDQQLLIDQARESFRNGHKSVLIQLPTGGGKTFTAAFMLANAVEKGNTCWFICPRIEIMEQTCDAFDKIGKTYGIIAAGYTPSPHEPLQICSIDTLKRRLGKIIPPKMIVWDETRSIAASGWSAVYKTYPDAFHIGLDATPCRLDGKGLGEYYTVMIKGQTYKELQALGSLVSFRVFSPPCEDMSGVKKVMGEFDKKQTDDIISKPTIVGDVIQHYKKYANGLKGITFAHSVKHSQLLVAEYLANGINAMHVDGKTPKLERKKIIEDFRAGRIQMLVNCELFCAGFDVPNVECIVMARPTQSLTIYLQQAGRGSRVFPGKTHCVLIDAVGNVHRHGLPDQDREWTLDSTPKRKKKTDEEKSINIVQCESCYAVYLPAPKCPHCGHEKEVKGRKIVSVDGELTEITEYQILFERRQRKFEESQAKTMDDFIRLGNKRGYNNPHGWATVRMRLRDARKRNS